MKNLIKLPKESNHDYALRCIRENIITTQLKPGTMLSEQDIANELNLSRTPVHEAIQEISKTKIIEVLPQRGSLVSLIDIKLVEEAVFIRETIETAITKEACRKATENDIKELEDNINLQEFFAIKNNPDKIYELDNEFHRYLYQICDKMLCYDTVRLIDIHYSRFRSLRMHSSDFTIVIEQHKNMLEAIKARDEEKAAKEFHNHLYRRFMDMEDIKRQYPDYFKQDN